MLVSQFVNVKLPPFDPRILRTVENKSWG